MTESTTNKKDVMSLYWYPFKRSQLCGMLSILSKSTLHKELNNFMTKKCFLDKKVNTQQQQQQQQSKQSKHKNPFQSRNETRDLSHHNLMRYLWTNESTELSIVVRLFNCFNVISQTITKQSQVFGAHFFNKLFFSVMF